MESVYVIGVGMTSFGRHLDKSIKDLTRLAVDGALQDAGVKAGDLQAAFFANCVQGHMEGQHMLRGQIALRAMGIGGIPVTNIENACTAGSTAFYHAVNQIKSGESDVALAIGAEKMFSADKERMFSAFTSGWDITQVEENKKRLLVLGQGMEVPPGTTSPRPYSIFMDVYAAKARYHMMRYGTTQRQIAAISAKNHAHSQHNPLAQYRNPYTIEQVLEGAPITYPFTAPMCSPVSDGAAAAIVCSEAGLRRLGVDRSRAIRVLASVLRTGVDREASDNQKAPTLTGGRIAYEKAGLGPQDVSVAELHDATAMGELNHIENLGFCAFGEGGIASERGETSLGGRIPVNTSGGLESRGHPVGATGLAQIYELVAQLRGEAGARQVENARVALAQTSGGTLGFDEAVACVSILGR
ncbi:thiolase [Alicycliphilus denitrificans]|uniref:thiolase family protein n=1 Tax=Alicycliphilus denitrificans TaxID=179636 RepID=UPI00095F8C8C|nr:thiolase family protein [Alicycliphilus denitrificans]OJW91357.1 MAG: thiolase [Alicycliphilus sp. 69-12]BCN38222.1 thiolase [Alicycliphilus denitrificans]